VTALWPHQETVLKIGHAQGLAFYLEALADFIPALIIEIKTVRQHTGQPLII
jgi:hypothetical protein